MKLPSFKRLYELFLASHYKLHLVGGCVRDALLGNDPKDYDFATDAPPEAMKKVLHEGGFKVIPIGERFGTIKTFCEGHEVEITTYRSHEVYTEGSRRPEVEFGHDLADDLKRRDLTINAMALADDGSVVDPFDGQGDLKAGVLRTPTDPIQTLRDDPLRLLRAARFAARYGFRIAPELTDAAIRCAHLLSNVSHERWKAEVDNLLVREFPVYGIDWLERTGAWPVISAEFPLHADWSARLATAHRNGAPLPVHWLAILGIDFDLEAFKRWWKASVDECEMMVHAIRAQKEARIAMDHGTVPSTAEGRAALRQLAFAASSKEAAEAALHLAALNGGNVHLALIPLRQMDEDGELVIALPKGLGNAIMERKGLKPGPAVAQEIARIRQLVIDGRLKNGQSVDYYMH